MAELGVRGLRELNRTFAHAPADVRKAYRAELRTVAEPIRTDAERLAVARIRKVTAPWSRMRTGVTQRLVYVAERQRGVKGRLGQGRRRPNFAKLLMDRAMEPALEKNRGRVEEDFDRMLDRLVLKWDREGP